MTVTALSTFLIIILVPIIQAVSYAATDFPWKNFHLATSVRVDSVIQAMTLDEKAAQLTSMSPAIPRLQWKALNYRSECCNNWGTTGSDYEGSGWNGTATVFPQVIAVAASFNSDLARSIGDAVSTEGRAVYNMARAAGIEGHMMSGLHCFGPTLDVMRDGRWGRIKRTYGEDPYLTGALGSAFIQGTHGNDTRYIKISTGTNMFAVHDGPDSIRLGFSASVSRTDMEDFYFPAHATAILDGGVHSVMVAYSAINFVPDNANAFLLQKILRTEMNFTGMTFSDNGGVGFLDSEQHYVKSKAAAAVTAMNAGVDQDMTSGGGFTGHNGSWNFGGCVYQKYLPDAVRQGLVPEARIDEALRRIVTLRIRMGYEDPPDLVPWSKLPPSAIGAASHLALARTAARESIVMLRNVGAVLPFGASVQRVAVIGPLGNDSVTQLGGLYSAFPSATPLSIFEALAARFPAGSVEFVAGCNGTVCPSAGGFEAAVRLAAAVDAVVFVGGLDGAIEHENGDRGQPIGSWTDGFPCGRARRNPLELPGCQSDLLAQLHKANRRVVTVVINGGPVIVPELPSSSPGATLVTFYAGQAGSQGLVDVLLGIESPSGRLPYSIPTLSSPLGNFTDYGLTNRTYRYNAHWSYPFGYGLTYESDAIVYTPSASADTLVSIAPCQPPRITVKAASYAKVYNVSEVVQVYVKPPTGYFTLTLVGFAKYRLVRGGRAVIDIQLEGYHLTVTVAGKRVVVPGTYTVYVGSTSPLTPSYGGSTNAVVAASWYIDETVSCPIRTRLSTVSVATV